MNRAVRMIIEPSVVEVVSRNPCVPSICGPNSNCKSIGETPVCSCLMGYIGRPPNCRPECIINADCPGNLACQNERCKNPCPSSCGVNADCRVSQHSPICSCVKFDWICFLKTDIVYYFTPVIDDNKTPLLLGNFFLHNHCFNHHFPF